jgi:hypothetical protein
MTMQIPSLLISMLSTRHYIRKRCTRVCPHLYSRSTLGYVCVVYIYTIAHSSVVFLLHK